MGVCECVCVLHWMSILVVHECPLRGSKKRKKINNKPVKLLIIKLCVCVSTWTRLRVAQCLLSVKTQADVPSVGWRGVAAGSCPHVVTPSTRH